MIDVSRSQLEATIVIEKPLSVQLDELEDNCEEKIGINSLIKNRRVLNIPIYELYIINENDEEEFYLKSAIIIENVRFFMKFIWRPWVIIYYINIIIINNMKINFFLNNYVRIQLLMKHN